MENYPLLLPPEPDSGLLKHTAVKNQAERLPHLQSHRASRVTATSISHSEVAENVTCLSRNKPNAWLKTVTLTRKEANNGFSQFICGCIRCEKFKLTIQIHLPFFFYKRDGGFYKIH